MNNEQASAEYGDIEHLHAVDPDDYIARLSRHRARTGIQWKDLSVDYDSQPAPRRAHPQPDTDTCPLWEFVAICGIFGVGAITVLGAVGFLVGAWS
jgi:hypothetical protein